MITSNERYYVERWSIATKDTLGNKLLENTYRSPWGTRYDKVVLHKRQTLAQARYCLSTIKRNPWTSATIRFVIIHDIT